MATLMIHIIFYMQLMKQPVGCRSKNEPYVCDKNYTTKNSIRRGEEFSSYTFNFRHWSHAAKNHGSVVYGIYPFNAAEIMIAIYAQQ